MSQRSKDVWRRATIEENKSILRQELARILEATDEDQLLSYLLRRIQDLQADADPLQLLRCFLLVIEALRYQERYGSLSKKQIQDLATLASSILKVVGIRSRHTPTSFLYTELHAALSALYTNSGEPCLALWELEIGNFAGDLPGELDARQNLAMGINALRMGQAESAGMFLYKALSINSDPGLDGEIELQLARTQRFLGDYKGASERVKLLMAKGSQALGREALIWEEACLEASQNQDLSTLLTLTKKGQPLHQNNYRLEVFLWAGCHSKTSWSQKIVKVTSGTSLKKINHEGNSVLFSIAQSLEMAYESQVPFPRRMEDIKKVFPKIKLLPKVEHELLVWLYLARWLYRCHHYKMAKVCFCEYESLCKKLSAGSSRDLIGLAADLLEIDWLQKAA